MDEHCKHILIFRFSALGDIAIAAPLLRAYALSNPDIRFTMVSASVMEAFFADIPNLYFLPIETKGRHKNLLGLWKLFLELMRQKPSHIADLHSVLRSKVLKFFFFFTNVKSATIDKGRSEKRALTKRKNKRIEQLPSMMSRYEEVLVKLGLPNLHFSETLSDQIVGNDPLLGKNDHSKELIKSVLTSKKAISTEIENTRLIGIAPFAKHRGKSWSPDFMEEVIAELSEDPQYKIFLFGGGHKEVLMLQSWEQKYSGVFSIAGNFSMIEEIEIIRGMDMMICMDSANMHFASLVSTPVISIWGATHPYTGFYGWNQKLENALQIEMECRPCSVFGNKECYRKDYACMNGITPQMLLNKIYDFFDKQQINKDDETI